MANEIIAEIRKDYISQLVVKGKRIDGRAFDEYREITLEKNVVESAEGSARVKIGGTDVLVGVKIEPGEPFPDIPETGVLTTTAELIPMASPSFEPGPPGADAIELARVVDRGIRESKTIDLEKMCITPGEKVWVVFVDIFVLDYDGNFFDASALGSIAALMSSTVPAEKFDLGENFPLPVNHYPVSCTSCRLDDVIVIDPSLDEENITTARLTVTTDENGDIRAMQKGLQGSFTLDEIKKIIRLSQQKGKEIREKFLGV